MENSTPDWLSRDQANKHLTIPFNANILTGELYRNQTQKKTETKRKRKGPSEKYDDKPEQPKKQKFDTHQTITQNNPGTEGYSTEAIKAV